MEYGLTIENTPSSIPGGTSLLLLHPSTGETDRIDTEFLQGDTDHFLIISTRTTAREVEQKLEYYEVDQSKATIIDTLSIERGYSRRAADHLHFVSAPDDFDGIIAHASRFLESNTGKRRVTVDSITEMAYYADENRAKTAVQRLLELIREHDAVGLFHLAPTVHDDAVVADYRDLFDGVIELTEDGQITADI